MHRPTSLFNALGFGPDATNRAFRDYLRLPFAVLGAVTIGWFVLDTGMSLVLGLPTHALLNLVFAIAPGMPLIGLRHSQPAPSTL